MKREEIKNLLNKFEAASIHVEDIECWSARELQPLLGYAKWDNFINGVVVKAKDACVNAGENIADHFPDVGKMISLGKGAEKHIDNNSAVRDMLLQRGIHPEQLLPGEDVKKVQKRIVSDDKHVLSNKSLDK